MVARNIVKNISATSISDEVVAGFWCQHVENPCIYARCSSLQLCHTRISCDGAWPILAPSQHYCIEQVKQGVADGAGSVSTIRGCI